MQILNAQITLAMPFTSILSNKHWVLICNDSQTPVCSCCSAREKPGKREKHINDNLNGHGLVLVLFFCCVNQDFFHSGWAEDQSLQFKSCYTTKCMHHMIFYSGLFKMTSQYRICDNHVAQRWYSSIRNANWNINSCLSQWKLWRMLFESASNSYSWRHSQKNRNQKYHIVH